MLKYNPTHHKYAGDANMIPAAQQNQASRDKIKDDARLKIGRPLAEDLQLSNFSKNPKKPSISEVPIHVCVGISHS